MRLSDVVASMNLDLYPIIGLALFLGVFIAVTIRALATSRRTCDRWAHLPLEVEPTGKDH